LERGHDILMIGDRQGGLRATITYELEVPLLEMLT